MEYDLLRTMGSDLGIKKFDSESQVQYIQRVLYSATASWVKAACLDHPITTAAVAGVSRRHVYDRVERVLQELLKRFPECQTWFAVEAVNETAVSLIRSRLMRHGEILNVGYETNISLANAYTKVLSPTVHCAFGEVIHPGMFYSGVAMLCKIESEQNTIEEVSCENVADWLDKYCKTAWWQKLDQLDETAEYFDARRIARNNQCWQSNLPRESSDILLARTKSLINSHDYLLIDRKAHMVHRIDPYLHELGEHRRFIMGLRYAAGNRVPARLVRYRDHVRFSLRVYLPQKETTLWDSFAWPVNSITDRLEWVTTFEAWEYIKPFMISLGLSITEETYG